MTAISVGPAVDKDTGRGVLAEYHAARKGLIIQAPVDTDIYVSFKGDDTIDATTGTGFLLKKDSEPYAIAIGNRCAGPVYAVADVDAESPVTVYVEEIT